MDNLTKIITIITNAFTILGKKVDNLGLLIKNQKPPVIKMDAPIINVDLKDIKIPEFPKMPEYPAFPEIPAPIVNIEKADAPIVNVEAPIVNVPPANITVQPTPVEFPKEMAIVDMAKLLEGVNRETEEVNLLKGISNTNPIPIMVVDNKGKQVNHFTSDISFPTSIELRIGKNKVGGSTPLPVAYGFQIPAYDTEIIDASLAPTTTIITYKLAGTTVKTKTITVVGTLTTITLT